MVITAPAPKSPSAKDTGLEGEWRLVAQEICGQADTITRTYVHVFQADGTCSSGNGTDQPTYHFHYTIDGTARPMRIDLKSNPQPRQKWGLGIFKVEGDTLTLCMAAMPEGERPAKFESTKDPPTWLYVYKRVKKKD
jgi:uncharacterized protein (TIGR03067 family)